MSYVQPRLGVFNATPFFFSQQPSQQMSISSLPETRLNESVQTMVTSQKSAPKSVTQTIETKKPAADREVIVLSSDSESDTETRRPVVSKKMKGKEKENVSYVNEGMRNKTLEASTSIIVDQTSTSNSGISVVNDDCQYVEIESLSNNITILKSTNKKNLLDDYALMSNKEKPSLFQFVNPVRIFLNILEDHKTNAGLFDIIVDFTRIYLEIYDEDKRIITRLHDLRALVVDLIYCLMSKMKDDHYMATSKRFKQVELLAQKAIEIIEKLKETGEILKRIEAQLHNERKRRNEEEKSLQEEKRRKQDDDRRFINEREREKREQEEREREREKREQEEREREREKEKREQEEREREKEREEREEKRREYKRQEELKERMLQKERRLQEEEREREIARKRWIELEKQMKSQANYMQPTKRLDHPSMPAPSQFVPYDIPLSQPRKKTKGEAEFVELLAEPLHELITAQVVYDLYRNYTPFRMGEAVSSCSVARIFRYNLPERNNYCKQLYNQYVNTDMDGTTKVLENWIKIRILEYVTKLKR